MNKTAAFSLLAGALANFAIAVLHILIIFNGPEWYLWFGAGERMANLAARHSPVPVLLTLGVTIIFIIMGLYGLSGCRMIKKLPLLRTGLITIAAIYTLRGMGVLPMLWWYIKNPQYYPFRFVIFSLVALVIGIFYTIGIVAVWKTKQKGKIR